MKFSSVFVSIICLTIALSGESESAPLWRPGEILVEMAPGAIQANLDAGVSIFDANLTSARFNANIADQLIQTNRAHRLISARNISARGDGPTHWILRFDGDVPVENICASYELHPEIEIAEPNYTGTLTYAPSDPHYDQVSSEYSLINLEQAWDIRSSALSAVQVAVIDSGVDPNHEDLWQVVNLDDSFNFSDGNTHIFDDFNHGTRVAGIIGAIQGNGLGAAGIASGCGLVSLDVADSNGVVDVGDVVAALNVCRERGIDVANMSLRFGVDSQILREICRAALDDGVLLVAAAGNEGQGEFPVYPASYNSVIGVGAILDDGVTRAPWSNFSGPNSPNVDLVAPGQTVFSPIPGSQYNGDSGTGTSYSAPFITGLAALLRSHHPKESARGIRSHMEQTARALESDTEIPWGGWGLIDAYGAMAESPRPVVHIESVIVDDSEERSPSNDGDGIWDVGEDVEIAVVIKNSGADADEIYGEVRTGDSRIDIESGDLLWGEVLSGGSEPSTLRILAGVPISAEAGSIQFNLDLMGVTGWYSSTEFLVTIDSEHNPPNVIGVDTTWTSNHTYVINTGVVVLPSATLDIEPGTVVRLNEQATLEIQGVLEASGTVDQSILFTSGDGRQGLGYEDFQVLDGSMRRSSLAQGDLDGDGLVDLVSGFEEISSGNFGFSVHMQNSAGFDAPQYIETDAPPTAIAIGDVGNDGGVDVVVGLPSDDRVWIYPWNGGGLSNPWSINVDKSSLETEQISDIVLADIDGDVDNDLVVVFRFGNAVSLVYWADGAFSTPVFLEGVGGASGVALVDFDGDGDGDIAAISPESGTLHCFTAPGYQPLEPVVLGQHPIALVEANLDDDDGTELIVANHGSDSIVVVDWEEGTFGTLAISTPENPRDLSQSDLNSDGFIDLLVVSDDSPHVDVFLGGPGGYGERFTLPVPFPMLTVGAFLLEGDSIPDILVTGPSGLGIRRGTDESALRNRHGGVVIRASSPGAVLENCIVQFGGILDESQNSHFRNCTFDRTGADIALHVTSSGPTIEVCRVLGNMAGAGVIAEYRDILESSAYLCGNVGLSGQSVRNSTAEQVEGAGIVGSEIISSRAYGVSDDGLVSTGGVISSEAQMCAGVGIRADHDIWSSVSRYNSDGIFSGESVYRSFAFGNNNRGIVAAESIIDCQSEGNEGVGITAVSASGCISIRNGVGIHATGSVNNSLVAECIGVGVSAESLTSASVFRNGGSGVSWADEVNDSWFVQNAGNGAENVTTISNVTITGNGSNGVLGRAESPFTGLVSSTIVGNQGSGVVACGPVNNCNLYDNGGLEYSETRPTGVVLEVDLSGNHWGDSTTQEMNTFPWGTLHNISAIHDFFDDISLARGNYQDHRAVGITTASPSQNPPSFLLGAQPSESAPAIGDTLFTLTFNNPMDSDVDPRVSFGLIAPYSVNVVEPSPGWVDEHTWQGSFNLGGGIGEGVHTIRVTGAIDSHKRALPVDMSNRFVVDASGTVTPNNGLVTVTGPSRFIITWDDHPSLATGGDLDDFNYVGYNVVRKRLNGEDVTQVNRDLLMANEFVDTCLDPLTIYVYEVYLVDSNGNSFSWTGPIISTVSSEEGDSTPIIDNLPNSEIPIGVPYTGPTPRLDQGDDGNVLWTLKDGPPSMVINSESGNVMWQNPQPGLGVWRVVLCATNADGGDSIEWILNVLPLDQSILMHLLGVFPQHSSFNLNNDEGIDSADLVRSLE